MLIRSCVYRILGVHLELARAYGLAMQECAGNVVLHYRSIFLDVDNDVFIYSLLMIMGCLTGCRETIGLFILESLHTDTSNRWPKINTQKKHPHTKITPFPFHLFPSDSRNPQANPAHGYAPRTLQATNLQAHSAH